MIGKPELPNDGHYNWTVGGAVPSRVFLRLTVRDTASNVAVAETNDPILVDLNEPDVKVLRAVAAPPR